MSIANLKRIIKVPALIANKLSSDQEIKRLLNLGRNEPLNDIRQQITHKATMTAASLNELSAAQSFVTISLNSLTPYETAGEAVLKVGVAVNTNLEKISDTLISLQLFYRISEILEENRFGLTGKIELASIDEAYFSDSMDIMGVVGLFILRDGDQDEAILI